MYQKVIVPASALVGNDGHFPEEQQGLYLGGKLRMEAALKIAKENPGASIFVVGGYGISNGKTVESPDQVADMVRFMKSHLPDIHLESVRTLPCTHHNFVGLLNTWSNTNEHEGKIAVLTNAYHMKRAMYYARQVAREIAKWPITFEPITAEKVLGIDLESYLRVHGLMNAYEERITLEKQGVKMLEAGTYLDPCFGKNFEVLLPLMREQGAILLTEDERIQIASDLQADQDRQAFETANTD